MNSYKLIKLNNIDSTNDFLKREYKNLPNNTFVTAYYQSKGKGQFDRVWESGNKENILLSWLFRNIKYNQLIEIKKSVRTSILKFLNSYNINAKYKYPNDIYIEDEKICGILIETKTTETKYEYVIVGIGININQVSFVNKEATSLKVIKKQTFDLEKLINDLINNLIKDISYI